MWPIQFHCLSDMSQQSLISRIVRSLSRRFVRQMGKWRVFPPLLTSRLLYRIKIGRFPDMRNPRDLNDVVMALQFGTDTRLWSELSDKWAVRDFVARRLGPDALVPLYQVADSVDEIDFYSLPDSFVIKTTDGYAKTLIVADKSKADIEAIRRRLRRWMRERLVGDEPHYLRIRRRIIIEKLLPGRDGYAPADYNFFCCDGEPLFCQTSGHRDMVTFNSDFNVYRVPEWTDTGGVVPECVCAAGTPRPASLETMMEYARRLSEGFPLVRVDLYEVEGKVLFGEMTFTTAAGRTDVFRPGLMREIASHVTMPPLDFSN